MEALVDLTEEEVNLDLSRNLTERTVKLDDLVKATYTPLPRTKESVIKNYSVAHHLRDFINNEGIRISYSCGVIIPVVFTPLISVKEVYDIVGYDRTKGLRELASMDVIDIGIVRRPKTSKRTIIKTNDFKTIRDGLATYDAKERFTKKRELREKFEKELGTLKVYIDDISASTSPIYQEFAEWCEEKEGDPQILLNNFMASKRARETMRPEVNLDCENAPKSVQ